MLGYIHTSPKMGLGPVSCNMLTTAPALKFTLDYCLWLYTFGIPLIHKKWPPRSLLGNVSDSWPGGREFESLEDSLFCVIFLSLSADLEASRRCFEIHCWQYSKHFSIYSILVYINTVSVALIDQTFDHLWHILETIATFGSIGPTTLTVSLASHTLRNGLSADPSVCDSLTYSLPLNQLLYSPTL